MSALLGLYKSIIASEVFPLCTCTEDTMSSHRRIVELPSNLWNTLEQQLVRGKVSPSTEGRGEIDDYPDRSPFSALHSMHCAYIVIVYPHLVTEQWAPARQRGLFSIFSPVSRTQNRFFSYTYQLSPPFCSADGSTTYIDSYKSLCVLRPESSMRIPSLIATLIATIDYGDVKTKI